MRRSLVLAPVLACAGLAAAAGPAGASPARGHATDTATPRWELRIALDIGGPGPPLHLRRRLTCKPPGGNVLFPRAACAALAARPRLLSPITRCRPGEPVIPDGAALAVTGHVGSRQVALLVGGCRRVQGRQFALREIFFPNND